jgi:serine protease Do
MGSPLALSQSVTLGIVSNLEMTFPRFMWPSTFKLDGEETGSLVRWIGHDAQISPGNSGGPLVDASGQIVGINEISLGLSGAIPGNLAREVAEEIIRHGEVRRSWIGLQLQPRLVKDSGQGVLVATVVPGSPAATAGLLPGDVLVRYAGKPVDARYVEELPAVNRLLMSTPIGQKVELVYRREGKEAVTSVVTASRGIAQGDEAELKAWGATVRELTLLSAKELQREPQSGVLVSSLRPGSSAAEAKPPLEPGDIVVSFAGVPVRTVDDLVKATEKAVTGKTEAVPALVGFERRTERLLTVVHLGGQDERDTSADARKAWLPASVQVLTADLAEALGLKGRTGVRVTEVYPGSTATAAGLKVGDVILDIDGEPIPTSKPEDVEVFSAIVRQYRVGTHVKLAGVRAGQPLALDVELASSPRASRELPEYRDDQFDFTARDLTFQDRVYFTLPAEQRGVIVTGVESGGWAALAHLAVADVILQVDERPVGALADLEARMKTIAELRPDRVVFFVKRGVQTLFLELEPAWDARLAREAR